MCIFHGPPFLQVYVEGKDVVPDVWEVLDKIRDFSGGVGGRREKEASCAWPMRLA